MKEYAHHKGNSHDFANAYIVQVLHELEVELHVDLIPGTEVMTDVGSHHFVKSAGSSDQVLVPQPSDDPHDPLVCIKPKTPIAWAVICNYLS
jgi:hypothetical protein